MNCFIPERRGRELQDDLQEHEEGEPWPALDDVLDLDPLLVRHEPQDGEDDDGGVERGERVHSAYHERVPKMWWRLTEIRATRGLIQLKKKILPKILSRILPKILQY